MSDLVVLNEQNVNWQIICGESCILAEQDEKKKYLISIKWIKHGN